MHAPKLLTVREVATILRVKPKTVRKWIAWGQLPATKPIGSKQWRVEESKLQQVLKEAA
jgi:excisionase family DNA binding protein